jgi:hypothetical protein
MSPKDRWSISPQVYSLDSGIEVRPLDMAGDMGIRLDRPSVYQKLHDFLTVGRLYFAFILRPPTELAWPSRLYQSRNTRRFVIGKFVHGWDIWPVSDT